MSNNKEKNSIYVLRQSEEIVIQTNGGQKSFYHTDHVLWDDITVRLQNGENEMGIILRAGEKPVEEITLTWSLNRLPESVLVLGDAWERTYGDNGWTPASESNEWMPWYFFVHCMGQTYACGVKTGPNAFCSFRLTEEQLQLKLDVRCGGKGVILNGRTAELAVLTENLYEGISSFQAARNFCKKLCGKAVFPSKPVYGSNNWYYAYGNSCTEDILNEAEWLSRMTEGLENRPYVVVDDCWQEAHTNEYNGGPWKKGNEKFPDMKGLADSISDFNVIPGIWFRPLLTKDEEICSEWRLERDKTYLDPSVPEVLAYLGRDMDRLTGWGFKLIKYDFSSWDIFGRWGFEMEGQMTENNWTFSDRSKTTAEIIKQLYQTIWEHAGGAVILGCNCIGHLAAGLMQVNRSGDDTSGFEWERTKKMGVHTTAFRLPQHKVFFDIDCDCVGIVEGKIPWEKNCQWLKLLAKSGSPLFISVKPGTLTAEQEKDIKDAYRLASVQTTEIEPFDWLETKTPKEWIFGGERLHFEW